jgi:D-inositol-3-phosphate glycosyltransferase
MKPNLLWVGDHSCHTGFAKSSEQTLAVLKEHYNIAVVALNYHGDPHPDYGYPIYPACPVWAGNDLFGLKRVHDLCLEQKPDIVVVQNDPWNVPAYLEAIPPNVPTLASMPVDGKNFSVARLLTGLDLAIFWTEWAQKEAKNGGFLGASQVIPLGVDLSMFYPEPRVVARKTVELPDKLHDAFLVGNVNRNQPRKRLDLTVRYFCEWVKDNNIKDAYLCMHVAPTGDSGWNIGQLMHYYGLYNRLILFTPKNLFYGATEDWMRSLYNCFDVMVTTTLGEGWGLPTIEGMACGVPQVVPTWAALGDWCGDAVEQVPCTETSATPNLVNVIGGVVDRELWKEALHSMYAVPGKRQRYSDLGMQKAGESQFRWQNIGESFHAAIQSVLSSGKEISVGSEARI